MLKEGTEAVDLVKIALEISRDVDPDLVVDDYLAKLEALAERVRQRCRRLVDVRQVLGQIQWVLFVEEGYRGNQGDYFDPRNSSLSEVIDRKTGIPLTLSLIYWRIAERLGLAIGGVNTPSHFLLRLEEGAPISQPLFIDPFHEGRLLDLTACRRFISEFAAGTSLVGEAHFLPCSPRIVVARLLRNLKAIHIASNDYPALLPVQRRLTALFPNDPIEQRDLGMLYCRLEKSIQAVPYLEAFLSKSFGHPEAEPVAVLLRAIRRESALRN